MLRTLADLVLAHGRSGRAAAEPAPTGFAAMAAQMGLAQRDEHFR